METKNYGTLINRVKALIIDSLVIMGMGVLFAIILSKFDNAPDSIRLISFLFVFFLYDPLFTSLFGGTIGHLIIGHRVLRDIDETKKLIFPLALVRFIFKSFLGWISLLTITGNKKNKAIHDSIVNSIVIDIRNK